MPNPPRPSDPSWRKGVKPAERKQETLPAWRREEQSPADASNGKRRRTLKISLGVLGMVGGLAGLIVLLIWLRLPRNVSFIFAGSGYEKNLAVPHNAYGWLGLNHLAKWT